VLFITASTARIDGGLYANGMASNGPGRDDPYPHAFDSGGAGGTLNLTFDTLTGSGAIAANGGDACLTPAHLLDPNAVCAGGGQGASGGGRIAITYHAISDRHGTVAANGGGNQFDGKPGERGGTGTVYRHRSA
jgi:hypothetical protein